MDGFLGILNDKQNVPEIARGNAFILVKMVGFAPYGFSLFGAVSLTRKKSPYGIFSSAEGI